jgi:hypothetical protein
MHGEGLMRNHESGSFDLNINENWKKALMVGAFAGAAYLLISGRRPAGFALAGIGMAVLAAEHPQRFEEVWNQAPHYLDRGTKVVNQISDLIDKVAEQGTKFSQMRRGGDRGEQQHDYLT